MQTFWIIFFVTLIAHSLAAKKDCNMTITDADVCSQKLMLFGDRENIIPSNDEEMTAYCSRMRDGIRCIRQYAKSCLPAFPQQIFGMFAFDAKRVLRRQCKLQKDRSEFMKHISCFLPKPYMEPVHLCADKYIIQLELIKSLAPNWRIPGICCSFHIFKDCVENNTQNLCEKKIGIETVDYISNIISSTTDDVLDFTCGPYKSIAKCDALMEADSWNKMKESINDNDLKAMRNKHKYLSVVPPLVEIITNFDM